MDKKGGFCTDCGHRVEDWSTLPPGTKECPACGTQGLPCHDANQVNVGVNWHELRILVIWAENYAHTHAEQSPGMLKAVYAIARRIEDQHPDRALACPLTFAGELRQLKDAFPQATIHKADGALDESLTKAVDEHLRINDIPPGDVAP